MTSWKAGVVLLVSVIVAVSLSVYGLAACNTAPPDAHEVDEQSQDFGFVMTTTQGDIDVALELSLSADEKLLVGARTLTHPDGTVEVEDVSLPAKQLLTGNYTITEAGLSVAELPGVNFEIEHAETTAAGSTMVMVSPDGQTFTLETWGELPYKCGPACIFALGLVLLIAMCGATTAYSIWNCAQNGNCWEYSIWSKFCSGSCHAC